MFCILVGVKVRKLVIPCSQTFVMPHTYTLDKSHMLYFCSKFAMLSTTRVGKKRVNMHSIPVLPSSAAKPVALSLLLPELPVMYFLPSAADIINLPPIIPTRVTDTPITPKQQCYTQQPLYVVAGDSGNTHINKSPIQKTVAPTTLSEFSITVERSVRKHRETHNKRLLSKITRCPLTGLMVMPRSRNTTKVTIRPNHAGTQLLSSSAESYFGTCYTTNLYNTDFLAKSYAQIRRSYVQRHNSQFTVNGAIIPSTGYGNLTFDYLLYWWSSNYFISGSFNFFLLLFF